MFDLVAVGDILQEDPILVMLICIHTFLLVNGMVCALTIDVLVPARNIEMRKLY